MPRRYALGLGACLLVVALSGCGDSDDSSTTTTVEDGVPNPETDVEYPPCDELYTEGAEMTLTEFTENSICTEPDGETVTALSATYDCVDGTQFANNDRAWWHDGVVHVIPPDEPTVWEADYGACVS